MPLIRRFPGPAGVWSRLSFLALVATACSQDVTPPPGPEPPVDEEPASGSVVFVGAGDIADCNRTGDDATAALLDSIPGTVYTTGDNAYPNGTEAEYVNCYGPTWGRHLARTRPTPGNHEYNTPGAAGYYKYYGALAGDSGKGYYSYELGAWHAISLNSNIDVSAGSPQLAWLRADLAASDARCTVAYWHHPRFGSGANYGGAARLQPIWDALYEAGVDLILNGHEHLYERFAPQKPGGAADPAFGIRQFVIGSAGSSEYPFGTPAANSEVRDNTTTGVVKFTLSDGSYGWEFVGIGDGTFSDSGTGTCHTAPNVANQPPVASAGGPYTGTGTVHFDGAASRDPDQDIPLHYTWDFGDGRISGHVTPTHAYAANGTYTVRLRVTDSRGATSEPATTTVTISNSAAAPIYLTGAGNIARCSNARAEATARILDSIPGWVLALGDAAFPNGSPADYANCYDPSWGRHLGRTHAAVGNHDYDLGNADAAFDYFGIAAGPREKGYYSFDVGPWHIIALNDNATYVAFGAGSEQENWLRADLAAHPAACTLAFWHVPLFLSSNTVGYTSNSTRKSLWTVLHSAGVDVVLNGHQHDYERMAPMTPDGVRNDAGGIRQFNVGTGGESLSLPTIAIHPNSEIRAAAYGVLRFTPRVGGYDWRFHPIAGETFTDAGSGTCH